MIDARYSGSDGSSTAIVRAPRDASASAISPTPCAKPLQMTTAPGWIAVPRTRLR